MKFIANASKIFFEPAIPCLQKSPIDEQRNLKYKLLYEYSHGIYKEEVQRFKDLEDKSAKLLTALSIISIIYFPVAKWVFGFFQSEIMMSLLSSIVMINIAFFARSWIRFKKALNINEVAQMPLDDSFIQEFNDDDTHVNSIYFDLYNGYKLAIQSYKQVNAEKSKNIEDGYNHLDKGFFLFLFFVSFPVFSNLLDSFNIEVCNVC